MSRQMMKTFALTPAALRGRLLDPGDPLCPFHRVSASRPAVNAALRLLAPAFDAVIDIGLAAGRWHEPVWACSRRCGVRLLIASRSRCRRAAFARACGSLVSTDWTDGRGAVTPNHPRWKLPWLPINPARVGITGASARLRAAMRAKNIPLVPFRDECGRAFYALPPLCIYVDDIAMWSVPPGARPGPRMTDCRWVDLRAAVLIAGTALSVGPTLPTTPLAPWAVLDLDDSRGTAIREEEKP